MKAKDPLLLSEATAKRAEYLASPAHLEAMKSLLSQTATGETLDDFFRAFDGMKVMDANTRKSSGTVEVIVGKEDTANYNRQTRQLIMRREKEGWKVLDFTALRETNPSRKGR